MHESVMVWASEQVERHGLAESETLEVGSLDVNGSVRGFFRGPYVGIDMRPGPGVDVVARADHLPFEDARFDVVISTEMLEHDPSPWLSMAEMGRVLRPGGHLLISTRGNGFPEHGFPSDYWRFMPATGDILLKLAGCIALEPTALDPGAEGILLHGVKTKPAKMAAIVYSTDNEPYVRMAVDHLRATVDPALTDIVVVDNGSQIPFNSLLGDINVRYDENLGPNAVFHRWMEPGWFYGDPPDYLAFLHCDLMVHERGWDERVMDQFAADPQLDLIGFVGSNEIDSQGGRGLGTVLNFRGEASDGVRRASPAEAHGRRMVGFEPAAVVDHCAMILRRTALERLTFAEGDYAPEHFYDRILSCEVLRHGGHIAILGIECDHFGGGIGPGVASADRFRARWLEAEGIAYDPADASTAVYLESQRRFLRDYRGFFPLKVGKYYQISRP